MLIRLTAFIALVVTFTACSKKQSNVEDTTSESAIHTIDTRGNKVTLEKPAERVIALFDPCVDILYMLGAEDKLIGLPAEVYFDPEQYQYFKLIDERINNRELPTPGSNDRLNIESVISLKPDLVITQQLPESLIKTLKSSGIAVYIATAQSFENVKQELSDIALLTGTTDRADRIAAYATHKIDSLKTTNSAITDKKRKKAYFTWANGKIFSTTGSGSMMDNCLMLAGVDNACPTPFERPNINAETLISWNPDLIVMWNDDPELFYSRPELARVKAVNQRDIYNLMPMFFYNPHTFKSICAAMAIHNFATPSESKNETLYKQQMEEALKVFYGEEKALKLIPHINKVES